MNTRSLMLRHLALLAILALVSGCTVDDTPPATPCAVIALADPVGGWRFQTDPGDIGIKGGWQQPAFDDSGWRIDIGAGTPWQLQGLDYHGVGWFRARVTLPNQAALLMAISGVDDVGTLWIDGSETGALGGDLKLIDLSRYAGRSVMLAIRVLDKGGYGGIKDPVRIGSAPEEVLTREQWVTWLASQHPDWPMPAWVSGGPAAWTMAGGLNAANESLVNEEGAIAPWAAAPTTVAWLYDDPAHALNHDRSAITFSLVSGHLPIPHWAWTDGSAKIASTLFYDERDRVLRWVLNADNTSGATPYRLLVAVTPMAANQTAQAVTAISAINPARLWVNGQPYLVAFTPPRSAGVGRLEDVMHGALSGTIPPAHTLGCAPAGDGAALLEYVIPSGQARGLRFAFPDGPGQAFPPDADVDARLADDINTWEYQANSLNLTLPDGRVENAFQASTGYLLLALDPDGPHPGPLAHDAVWTRDAAYIGLALLQTDHSDRVRAYLPDIWAGQSVDGRVPPITGKAIPWTDDEWDAQGEAIFLTTSVARYTGDISVVRQYYPQIRKAAEFIQALRARNTASGPAQGLLPPSLSAEDLGPNANHYYWDDFWAVTGLDEAAYAARTLGETGDAAWMSAEAVDLRAAIRASITAVMGDNPAYIPGAVEDTLSSSAARGSVPALWPEAVFSPDDPLLARSFDAYHQKWIDPYQGGFLHRDAQFWPGAALELAHAYQRLGRGDVMHQILGWTLSHQTLPGTYAWADEVSPSTGGISGGDMPHGWVAASYVSLVRDILVSEQGDAIRLFYLAPDWWFEANRTLAFSDAPTWFGPLTVKTESTIQNTNGKWSGTLTLTLSGAKPPGGFTWKLPQSPSGIDGPPGTAYQDGLLSIPSAGGTIRLTFGP